MLKEPFYYKPPQPQAPALDRRLPLVDSDVSVEKRRFEVLKGELILFLREVYLDGYLKGKPSVYRELPLAIVQFLAHIVGDSRVQKAKVVSFAAKALARGGVSDESWQVREEYNEIAKKLSGKSTRPDIDVNLLLSPGTSTEELIYPIAQFYEQKNYRVHHAINPKTSGWGENVAQGFELNYQGLIVRVVAGHVGINPNVKNLKVYFFAPGDKNDPIFAIDGTVLAQDALQAQKDTRKEAGLRQDECEFDLKLERERLCYEMSSEAQEVMYAPDRLMTLDYDVSGLLTKIFRSLRTHLTYPNFRTNSGIRHALEGFVVEADSGEVFELRAHIQDLIGLSGSIPAIAEGQIPALARDFGLLLMYDPLIWHELVDTGVTQLLPGTAKLTRAQLHQMLVSPTLLVNAPGGKLPRWNQRTRTFISEQLKEYRSLGLDGRRRHFDGIQRTMQSFRLVTRKQVSHGQELEELKDLFRSPASSQQRRGVIFAAQGQGLEKPKPDMQTLAQIQTSSGRKYLLVEVSGGNSPGPDEFREVGSLLIGERVAIPQDELNRALHRVRQRAENTNLSRLANEFRTFPFEHEFPAGSRSDVNGWHYLRSLALLEHIVRRFPAGLTPRELRRLYEEAQVEFKFADFDQLFFDIKLLGLVARDTEKRITSQRQVRPVDMYYPFGGTLQSLLKIVHSQNDGVMTAYRRFKGVDRRTVSDYYLGKQLGQIYDLLIDLGVNSAEGLLLLEAEDIVVARKRYPRIVERINIGRFDTRNELNYAQEYMERVIRPIQAAVQESLAQTV